MSDIVEQLREAIDAYAMTAYAAQSAEAAKRSPAKQRIASLLAALSAPAPAPAEAVPTDADEWLRQRFGVVRGHPEWRALVEAFNAGRAAPAAPAAAPAPAEAVQIEALAHRIAWRYKKSSDPNHSDTYTFNRATLLQFAAALAAPAAPAGCTGMEPTEYEVGKVQIVSRRQLRGPKLWAVVDAIGQVLNAQGEWEWEPMPSERDADFMARCRFASPLAARDAYMRHLAAAPGAQGDAS